MQQQQQSKEARRQLDPKRHPRPPARRRCYGCGACPPARGGAAQLARPSASWGSPARPAAARSSPALGVVGLARLPGGGAELPRPRGAALGATARLATAASSRGEGGESRRGEGGGAHHGSCPAGEGRGGAAGRESLRSWLARPPPLRRPALATPPPMERAARGRASPEPSPAVSSNGAASKAVEAPAKASAAPAPVRVFRLPAFRMMLLVV